MGIGVSQGLTVQTNEALGIHEMQNSTFLGNVKVKQSHVVILGAEQRAWDCSFGHKSLKSF